MNELYRRVLPALGNSEPQKKDMRTKLLFLGLVMVLVSCCPVRGAWVVGQFEDPQERAFSSRVTFIPVPQYFPQAFGTKTILPVTVSATLTNGAMRVWLVGGPYRVEWGSFSAPQRIIVPPNDTNTFEFNYCASLATNLPSFTWTNTAWQLPASALIKKGPGVSIVTNNPGRPTESLTVSAVGTNGILPWVGESDGQAYHLVVRLVDGVPLPDILEGPGTSTDPLPWSGPDDGFLYRMVVRQVNGVRLMDLERL